MKSFTKWIFTMVATALMVDGASAAATVAAGSVKSIDANKKTFVLTDSAKKDYTFKIGDDLIVNRAGEESKGGLKAGDAINVCYEDRRTPWVSRYILVQEGDSKGCELIRGKVKGYDAEKKVLSFTSDDRVDTTYPMGEPKVSLHGVKGKIEDITIGDAVLLIVHTADGRSTLQSIMVDRAHPEK